MDVRGFCLCEPPNLENEDFYSFPPLHVSVLDLYECSGVVLVSLYLKLLVLNWISPSCRSILPVLVNETVLCDTAPCYLSPACLYLCQALPRLPISVPFCLAFRMCFSSHSPLRVCLTAASFCTCKGCVVEPGQGRQVAGSSSDKLQALPVSDSLFEGKGLQAGMHPSLSSWL